MSKQLNKEDREFLQKVLKATLANPFSKERDAADNSILEIPGDQWQDRLPEVVSVVLERVGHLKKAQGIRFEKYDEEDRRLLTAGILFAVFHSRAESIDNHINEQLKEREKVSPFEQGLDIIRELTEWGFKRKDAIDYLGLFFQLRRAFYLLEREVVGESPVMQYLKEKVWQNLFTHKLQWYLEHLWGEMEHFSTLILGETGVGKTAIARVIGCSGYIPYEPKTKCFKENFLTIFQAINLSQFPASLMESELFGHSKGAFTGAIENRKGIFDRCSPHGSIFIDELGEISRDLQVKFLNVLQDRCYTPVGSGERRTFKGRIIGATNQNIHDLVRGGRFRQDLYYRLCPDIIEIPPLRSRLKEYPGELMLILNRLISRVSPSVPKKLVEQIEKQLYRSVGKDYDWPGNIRELEQAVRRISLTGCYEPIDLQNKQAENGLYEEKPTAKALLKNYAAYLYQDLDTFEAVARTMGLDTRTVKKHLSG